MTCLEHALSFCYRNNDPIFLDPKWKTKDCCYVAFGNGAAVKNRTQICKGKGSILPVANPASASKSFINAKPKKLAGNTAIHVCFKLKLSQIDTFRLTGSESLWLKIWKNDSTKALVIASNYRHPSEDINQFICDFSDCQEKLSNEKKHFTFLVT